MLRSAVDLPDDGITAGICVVGAGAAGITIAMELDQRGRECVLLEAGGEQPAADAEAFGGTSLGRPYPVETTRLRGFGGTTGHWTGLCRPLDDVDFQQRPWIPGSGWPIDRSALGTYYERAHTILELGPFDYSTDRWRRASGLVEPPELDGIDHVTFQYSPPTRFGDRYRRDVEDSDRIDAITGATAVSVALDENGRLSGVDLVDAGRRRLRVTARHVVLATGAIETARLLLASDDVMTTGVGNGHDLVGRYFMEHPIVWQVPLIRTDPVRRYEFFALNEAAVDGRRLRWRGHLAPSAEARAQHELLGSYVAVSLPGLRGLGAMAAEAGGAIPDAAGLLGPWAGSVRDAVDRDDLSQRVGHLSIVLEQAPDPQSRVTVDTRDRDRYGLPRVQLDWRLSDADRRSFDLTLRLLGTALGSGGAGRIMLEPPGQRSYLDDAGPASHHLGTVRMGDNPSTSVVDRDGQLHDVAGLWVAGGAAFPTAGFANPTLTIVALAVRLAEHLAAIVR